MEAKNHLWQVTAVLHTGIVSICSKRNYSNYRQNMYALTEMCDFLLRVNYLTALILHCQYTSAIKTTSDTQPLWSGF